ncbi:DNA-directed DNA polymerase, family B, mitochondria/virus [Corchorus olitorius]|uniref:DNA-directed DNA polymerase, family B, mitochondria/virus n=1 Tax=Corchorus olitorius TaxID=93759 RepID=A0A1R3L3M8_9ROSI|nr:DNA-directed DNA polymerase, family B, mitochondria/virus [Corchorus olitorius]
MIGHAALVQGVYEQSVKRDEYGNQVARFSLSRPRYAYFKNNIMALLPHDKSLYLEEHRQLPKQAETDLQAALRVDDEDVDEDSADPSKDDVVFQHSGIIERVRDVAVVVKNPVHCSKRVNTAFRRVQRGGRCEVFAARNRPGTSMVSIDAKSMYPSTMALGLSFKIDIEGEKQACSVLRDYVDPRLVKSGWSYTECSDTRFAGIRFECQDELGQIPVFKVQGRQSVLRFLQRRGGMFYARLPQSACEFFRKYPVIPVSTMGSDIDARLVFPDWKGFLHTYITGEELAYFLSEPTVDDEGVEIDLNRSLHAPLNPTNVFGGFVGKVFKERSESGVQAEALDRQAGEMHARMLAGEAISRDEIERLQSMSSSKKAEEQILKLVLNSGGRWRAGKTAV